METIKDQKYYGMFETGLREGYGYIEEEGKIWIARYEKGELK